MTLHAPFAIMDKNPTPGGRERKVPVRGKERHSSDSSYDPAAYLESEQQYDSSACWDKLERRLDAATERQVLPLSVFSLSDLKNCISRGSSKRSLQLERPETTRLDLLQSWKQLLKALREEQVFTEYAALIDQALTVTLMDPSEATQAAQQYTSSSSLVMVDISLQPQRIRTLLDLLTQAVREHNRDASIECRFVTLLEILLSYRGASWQPSAQVAAFWVRLLQRIPSGIAPVNFRRKAYRVLVSLSWVPSSKGLLEACSFEVKAQQIPHQLFSTNVPRPLPRYDSVNQLLDRLKDETDVCVAIVSTRNGMGKTTLARQVASHPSIARVFTVLWLSMRENPKRNIVGDTTSETQSIMTYPIYITYLDQLCQQMNVPSPSWPCWKEQLIFEEPALRRLRERDCIAAAQRLFKNQVLARLDQNLLLVLDDVIAEKDFLDWFRFNDRQSLIVTTPHSALTGADWTLELVPMSEEEAIDLFLLEADLPTTHILGCTHEVRSIVKQCDCNPLTVRTIARWFQLKKVTGGILAAVEEILEELRSLSIMPSNHDGSVDSTDYANDPNLMLFDVLSLMMGPSRARASQDSDVPSSLFVLCFAAYVVVFPKSAPLDAVLLLWEQILQTEPLAIEEMGEACPRDILTSQVWVIAEGLLHMGVLSITEIDGTPCVDVHHELYRDFAILMACEMDLKETVEDTIADWHMAFVTGYFSRKSRGDDERHDGSWKYTMEKLASHMFEGKMALTAESVLVDKSFFLARMEALGWVRGMRIQIEDCVSLQHELEEESENQSVELQVSAVFQKTNVLMQEFLSNRSDLSNDERVHETAQVLFSMGFALAEMCCLEAALEHLEIAEKMEPSSKELQASILYAVGWCLLENNQIALAKQKVDTSRKIVEVGCTQHVLYKEILRLSALALIGIGEYAKAAVDLEEALDKLKEECGKNLIEMGVIRYMQGRLFHMMGEKEKAKNALENSVKWKVDNNETSFSLAAAQGMLGDIKFELNNLCEAKEQYEAALLTLSKLNCDDYYLDFRLVKGKLQFLRNDMVGCKKSFDLVRRTIQDVPLTVFDQSAYDLRQIARVYESMGDTNTSIAVLRESLMLTLERTYSLERAWGLCALGDCLVKKEQYTEALSCFEQALGIQQDKLGDGIEAINTTNSIGTVCLCLKENNKALGLLTENLHRAVRVVPHDSESIASIQFLLGDAYVALCDYDQATNYFNQCIDKLKLEKGDDHLDLAKALHRLGDVAAAQHDINKAFAFYSQALDIRRMHFDDKVVAETLLSMAALSQNHPDLKNTDESRR